MRCLPKNSVFAQFLVLLLPITHVFAACGADWCSCSGGYTTGTSCEDGECYCFCSNGIIKVIDDNGDCSGLSGGAIAGIVIGVLLIIALIGTCFFLHKKRNAGMVPPSSPKANVVMSATTSSAPEQISDVPPPASHLAAQDHTAAIMSADDNISDFTGKIISRTIVHHPDGSKTITITEEVA